MKVYLEKIIKSLNDQEMNFAINKEHTIPFNCKLAILEGLSNNKDLIFPKAKFAFELLNLIKNHPDIEINFSSEEGALIFDSVYKLYGLNIAGQVCFEE